MGSTRKTPSGAHRALWRDPSGRQRSKTFKTKREANAFLAEIESALHRGTYVDPDAGRLRFGTFAARWLDSREVEARTAERTMSIMRTHVLPQWSEWPLAKIDHMAVQEWVSRLSRRRARGTVVRCHSVLSMILKTAVRARLVAVNPAEGVKIPANRQARKAAATVSQAEFFRQLLPAVSTEVPGARLRRRWRRASLGRVRRLALGRRRPRARAAQRRPGRGGDTGVGHAPTVPQVGGRSAHGADAGVLVDALTRLPGDTEPTADDLIFPSRSGGPLRRNNFRRRVWLPSLVRAGMLGQVEETDEGFRASWRGTDNKVRHATFATGREAVVQVAKLATGGLRFHDMRHSYATWLVSQGLPVNIVRKVMGHEQISTNSDTYTHAPDDYEQRVTAALDGPVAFLLPFEPAEDPDGRGR